MNANFDNFIPPTDKIALIELTAQGLMSEGREPNYVLYLQGKTLLKNDNNLYYLYRNLSSKKPEDLYKYNHMNVGANIQNWNFEIGDSYMNYESSLYGRGITLGYRNNSFFANGIVNKSIRSNTENLGVFTGYNFKGGPNLKLGFSYNDDKRKEIKSIISTLETKFKIRRHAISLLFAANPIEKNIDGKLNHLEYSGELRYSSKIKSLRNSLRLRYASPNYYGNYKGRLMGSLNSQYEITKTNRINLFTIINNNTKPVFNEETYLFNNINNNLNARLLHSFDVTPKVNIYYGPNYERYQKNQIADFNSVHDNDFISQTIGVLLGSRFRFDDPYTTLSPRVTVGNVSIQDYPRLFGENLALYDGLKNYFIYYLDVNFRTRKWYLLASYESGPRNIYSQYNYFFISRSTRTLRLMPSYSAYIYKNIMHLDARVSFSNDMILKNSFINTSMLFTWYLPKYWSTYVNTYYTITNRTTSSGVESYQSLYLEAGIKKELNLPHPRVSYHNLGIILFKDINGNYKQEPNEPGIGSVLVSLSKVRTAEEESIPGDVGNIELMSNYLGRVDFTDIPNGIYKVQFTPVGSDVGTFSKSSEELTINLQKNTIEYFPFVEKNKVFGKIILNRSRLSGLGKVDVSNVRITATDSQGRSFSSLTNNNGEFTLFAPVTDEYIVSINNIFYENFDLRQNNFVVQFNGYKQFEVNFVFDEKVRRINFAATDSEIQSGVMQVRRTTISGTVKDANTQQPVRAKVNLINTRTNSIVTSTNSSATSGDYTINFIASDNYLLEVLADDYWYLSENLVLQQITTFMNIKRDVLLRPVSVGSKIELNIKFDINSAFLAPESVAELNRLLRQTRNNPTVKLEIQGHCDELEAIRSPGIALERANAVAAYLIENGYSNIEVKSYDNKVPAASNDTEEGRARNRRIEVVVLSR